MFFKIDSSLMDLVRQTPTPSASVIFGLDELFRARRIGNHLIYCKASDLEAIEGLAGLSDSTRLTIKKIKPLQRFKKTAFESMTTYVNIVAASNTVRTVVNGNKSIIEISIDQLANGDFLGASTILAENLTDCEFFKNITSIANQNTVTLKGLLHSSNPLSGGGSQTPRQYRQQKTKKTLTICIVDGDIEYQGAPLGTNTADPIFKDDISNPRPYCASLILDCYSIENLIPADAISAALNLGHVLPPYLQRIKKFQASTFWPYIPLKQGKKCTDFTGGTPKSIYWTSHKQNFTPTNPACLSWNNGACAQPCEVIGLMPKSTAQTVAEFFSRAKSNDQLSQITQGITPLPQQIEVLWNKVAANVNSWTCSGDRISGY